LMEGLVGGRPAITHGFEQLLEIVRIQVRPLNNGVSFDRSDPLHKRCPRHHDRARSEPHSA
jgi:hypothetical protein